jgi:REP-associated tyrosine transposase
MSRWKVSSNTVHNVGYHIIWCSKDRRKVLVGNVESRIRDLVHEISAEIGVTMEKMAVMPEHLHVSSHPGNARHYIVQQLKGRTSRILRSEFHQLRSKLPTLWTRSYYLETIGHISEETIKRYIEDQKKV